MNHNKKTEKITFFFNKKDCGNCKLKQKSTVQKRRTIAISEHYELLKNIWLYLQKKHFTIVKRGPQVIDEDKFRFDMFVLLIEEWLRRKLKVRLIVECLR